MAIEIVSFPMNSMVIFHSYVNVYQRVWIKMRQKTGWKTRDDERFFNGMEGKSTLETMDFLTWNMGGFLYIYL